MSGKRYGAEGLRVYHLALDFLKELDFLLQCIRIRRSLADQLLRAAESIILNISEGAAHFSAGKKIYHYQLALGSASECITALTRVRQHTDSAGVRHGIRTANMIVVMLTSLIKAEEKRR